MVPLSRIGLGGLSGKQELVNMQVTKPTQRKFERNKSVLLSVFDIIKTIGKMGIALRDHQNYFNYHPDDGEPWYGGLGKVVELFHLTIRQKIQV